MATLRFCQSSHPEEEWRLKICMYGSKYLSMYAINQTDTQRSSEAENQRGSEAKSDKGRQAVNEPVEPPSTAGAAIKMKDSAKEANTDPASKITRERPKETHSE